VKPPKEVKGRGNLIRGVNDASMCPKILEILMNQDKPGVGVHKVLQIFR